MTNYALHGFIYFNSVILPEERIISMCKTMNEGKGPTCEGTDCLLSIKDYSTNLVQSLGCVLE